jgi:hypothetical protein
MSLDYVFTLGGMLSVLPLIFGAWLVWDHPAGFDDPQTGDQASPQFSSDDVGLILAIRRASAP